MTDVSGRPWRKRLPGVSRIGVILLLVGLAAFGYGIVQRGLPSSSADSTAADLYETVAKLERQMDTQTDPAARERLRTRINEFARAADRSLMASRQRESEHAIIAIFGGVVSLAGIIVLIVHRRRTQNLI
jgi:hypothetical protein